MSTAAPPSKAFDRDEPIPGYRTENLLGRGGYGEVWRAIAPGCIPKAIKIVYGDANAANAESELRALSRIKDVRHPLLLSIERIEVIHGNLIIVTELADRSLMDHFRRLRQAQSIGVPQYELLNYVRDVAEVLDFLYASYSLQHLDVKPENILLVSGRAKLGDFGLVKNLYERGGSQIGGLTPTYAPPELFEGRPTRQSDQYSLAIVYVFMLTGGLPFLANNTAEMATQHSRGVPDLSALPRPQRSVIARALSKNPSLRFANCTTMVAALKEAAHKSEPLPATGDSGSATNAAAESGHPACVTTDNGHSTTAHVTCATGSKSTDSDETSAGAAPESPRIHARGETAGLCPPTILIGVGGAGVDVLGGLVERLHDRFGSAAHWPPVEFLAVDSNTKTLSSRFKQADLERVQIVPIPLKPAESYGAQAGSFLKWLGRRWFYNIPRDLTTGGYRPLGRLALLTHGHRVREGVAAVISRAAERSSDHAAAANGPRSTNSAAPRVIVIGSIGGGTGSGAILDLTYTVRSELKRRGISDEHVHGVLLHAVPRSHAARDKSRANAYATLKELHHFSCPGSHFPGEPLLDVPPFHGDNATFAGTHLLLLENVQGEAAWKLATDQAAEFVYGITVTSAASILNSQTAVQNEMPAGNDELPQVRSYHVLSLGAGGNPTISDAIRQARHDVIGLWRHGSPSAAEHTTSLPADRTAIMRSSLSLSSCSETAVALAVKRQFAQLALELSDLLADTAEIVKLEAGEEGRQFVSKFVDDCLLTTQDKPAGPERAATILAMIDRFLKAEFPEGREEPGDDQLFAHVADRLAVRTRSRINSLIDWIRNFVNAADVRVAGARKHAVAAEQLLHALHENALAQASELHNRVVEIGLTAMSEQIHRPERGRFGGWNWRRTEPLDKSRECLKSYGETCLAELLHRAVAKVSRLVVNEVSTLIEQLDRLFRDLNLLSGSSPSSYPAGQNDSREIDDDLLTGSAPELVAYRRMLREQLRIRRHDIARQIDEVIERQLSESGQGIMTFLDSEAELQRLLGRPLDDESRQAVLSCIQEINAQLVEACGTESDCEAMRHLGALIAANLAATAGALPSNIVGRVLIIPDTADPAMILARPDSMTQGTSIVQGRKCDITLCSIRRQTSFEVAADEIINGVELYRDLANRLHTRVDITWRPFAGAAASADATKYDSLESSEPTRTVVLSRPLAARETAFSDALVGAAAVPAGG